MNPWVWIAVLRSKARYWFSRWPLAHALNRLSWMCWCDLVDWALAGTKPREERQRLLLDDGGDRYRVLNRESASRCREAASDQGACYCAKFRTAEVEERHTLGPGVVVPPIPLEGRCSERSPRDLPCTRKSGHGADFGGGLHMSSDGHAWPVVKEIAP